MKKEKQNKRTALSKSAKSMVSTLLLLIAMLMPQGAWAISGSGTSSSPYLIANEADLRTFQQYVENGNSGIYGKLTADITLTSAWTRIGRADRRFTGYFDGQGHTISGMNLSFTAYEHGFFGFVNNATIKNFNLTGTMTSSANGNHSHGTVVGSAAGTTVIENVTSSVNLTLNHTGFTCIGGIVGHMADNTRVTGCTYTGTINLTKDSEQVGGIVGYAQNDLYITDNVFSGTITSTGTCKYLAGIAGKTDGTIEVSGCTNIGTINGGPSYDCVAGIVGYVQYQSRALITNCYFGGSLSSTSSGTSLGMGGILGAVNDDAGTNFRGLTYCFSDGTLTATNSSSTQIGGIAGVIKSKAVSKVMNNTYLSGTASRLAAISNSSSSFDSSNKAITISVTAGTGGEVSQSYVYPTSTTAMQLHVEATTSTGYHYIKWSDNGAQTHNVSLTNNVSLTATFGAHTYGDWITDVNATCGTTGTQHRVCTHTGCDAREDGTIAVNHNLPHTFAANDAAKGVCTVCKHGFLRYTSKNNVVVTPKYADEFYNGSTKLTILSNANGVMEFNKPLTKIGTSAFLSCTNLTSITFPGTLTTINYYAFSCCYSLSGTLTIPSSVTSIGQSAFEHTNFSIVRNECTTPQSFSNIFLSATKNTLQVPSSAVAAYRAAAGWNEFKSIVCISHNFNQQNTDVAYAKDPVTCTTDGIYYYSCSVCGEKSTNSTFTVAALQHDYSVMSTDEAYHKDDATCLSAATYWKKCSRCTAKSTTSFFTSQEDKDKALSHIMNEHAAKPATCTEDGNLLYYTCSQACCSDKYYKDNVAHTTNAYADFDATVIGKLNHDYHQVVDANYLVSPATCTIDAVYHEKCSRCTTHGAEWSATGTATGNHSYTNNTLTASPIEDGLYAYACDYGCGTHTDDHIIKDFYGEGNHLELTKDGEGNYSTSEDIIINDPASFYSSVDFSSPVDFSAPSVTFNRYIINDGGMWSFIVPFDIPAAQAAQLGTFYQYRTHGEGKVHFDNIARVGDGIVRANTAYFFEPTTDFTSITVDDAEIKATTSMPNAENPSEPGLYGTYSQIDIPVGAYGYAMHEGQSTFVKAGTGNLLRSFRAYLWLGSGASMAKVLAIFGDYDDITGINNIETDTDLDMSKPIYTLSGQRIMTPKKGEIYIQNGKKVMKK